MKKSLVPLLLAAAVTQVFAAEAPTNADRLVDCTGLRDSAARLACFDREIVPFARSRVASAAPQANAPAPPQARSVAPAAVSNAAPAAASPPPAPPPADAVPSLGTEQLESTRRQRDQEQAPSLTARITTLREAGGAYVVTLDNGQIWRHENQHLGSYLRQGEAVTIRKATLGSYRLTRDAGDSKDWIRVTRVR
jgi:hypothetical protein